MRGGTALGSEGHMRVTFGTRPENDRFLAAMDDVLTPHQRRVLVALAVNGVPIDVLADRLSTTRGALYKTLHDARAKLRAHLEETS